MTEAQESVTENLTIRDADRADLPGVLALYAPARSRRRRGAAVARRRAHFRALCPLS